MPCSKCSAELPSHSLHRGSGLSRGTRFEEKILVPVASLRLVAHEFTGFKLERLIAEVHEKPHGIPAGNGARANVANFQRNHWPHLSQRLLHPPKDLILGPFGIELDELGCDF